MASLPAPALAMQESESRLSARSGSASPPRSTGKERWASPARQMVPRWDPARVLLVAVVLMFAFILIGLTQKDQNMPALVPVKLVTQLKQATPSILPLPDGQTAAAIEVQEKLSQPPQKSRPKSLPQQRPPTQDSATQRDTPVEAEVSVGEGAPDSPVPIVGEGDRPADGTVNGGDRHMLSGLPRNEATAVGTPQGSSRHGEYWANIKPDPAVTMLVVVPTSYSTLENNYRKTVRETWGKRLQELQFKSKHLADGTSARARLFFFIGTRGLGPNELKFLEDENRVNKDLVLLDFEESYKGLSAKMLLIHMWIHDNLAAFPSLRFCFKTDTDVWFNVPLMMQLVDNNRPTQTMIGYKYVNNVRLLKGKWANPEFSAPVYPQYMAGAGYLMSPDISSWVALNARAGWLKPLPNEDAVLGIWLAGSPVQWLHSSKFKPLVDPRQPARITRLADWVCRDDDILFHHLTGDGIRRMNHWFGTCGSPCEATCRQLEREKAQNEANLAQQRAAANLQKKH